MAENYNLGSNFGLNVSGKNVNRNLQKIAEAPKNLFDLATNYVEKYENVLNGDVEKEINMYSRQAMIVSMNLKSADGNRRNFDMNI